MRNPRLKRLAALVGAGLLCVSCAPPPFEDVSPVRPGPRPAVPERPAAQLDAALAAQFAETEARMLTQGLLRTDAGEPVVDAEVLASNFLQIALFDEYSQINDTIVAREQASVLRRWQDPVRVRAVFGPAVPNAIAVEDTATLGALVGRLATVSGHDIALASEDANFDVFVLSETERQSFGPTLRASVPGVPTAIIDQITGMPESIFCLAVAFSEESRPAVYVRAIAVVRAELPPLLRRSCLHEEVAQGLGLANDSRRARPSLFNDDQEFALLTGQDELMVQMLYDARLTPGMTLPQARPVVLQIARELLGPSDAASAAPPLTETPPLRTPPRQET